jgi:hypothetical protein
MAIKKSKRPSFWGGLAILLSLEKWSNKEINWSRIRLFCFVGRRVVRVSGQPHNRHFHPRDKERQNRREQNSRYKYETKRNSKQLNLHIRRTQIKNYLFTRNMPTLLTKLFVLPNTRYKTGNFIHFPFSTLLTTKAKVTWSFFVQIQSIGIKTQFWIKYIIVEQRKFNVLKNQKCFSCRL